MNAGKLIKSHKLLVLFGIATLYAGASIYAIKKNETSEKAIYTGIDRTPATLEEYIYLATIRLVKMIVDALKSFKECMMIHKSVLGGFLLWCILVKKLFTSLVFICSFRKEKETQDEFLRKDMDFLDIDLKENDKLVAIGMKKEGNSLAKRFLNMFIVYVTIATYIISMSFQVIYFLIFCAVVANYTTDPTLIQSLTHYIPIIQKLLDLSTHLSVLLKNIYIHIIIGVLEILCIAGPMYYSAFSKKSIKEKLKKMQNANIHSIAKIVEMSVIITITRKNKLSLLGVFILNRVYAIFLASPVKKIIRKIFIASSYIPKISTVESLKDSQQKNILLFKVLNGVYAAVILFCLSQILHSRFESIFRKLLSLAAERIEGMPFLNKSIFKIDISTSSIV